MICIFIHLFQNINSYLHFTGGKIIDLPVIIGKFDKFLSKNEEINGFVLFGMNAFNYKKL
jgi:hypothetical protein